MVDSDGEFGLNSREAASNREAPNKHIKGSRKYREMIDRGCRADEQKNLPFSFSKPKRPESRSVRCICPSCGATTAVTKNTVMVICAACPTLYCVQEGSDSK